MTTVGDDDAGRDRAGRNQGGGASVAPHTAPDDVDQVDDVDDVIVLSWWQNPVNVVALAVATLIIGAAAGWMFGDGSSDRADDEASVGFLQDMRYHHDQAVAMSMIYLDAPDTEPGLRVVARTMLTGQSIEIGRMIQMLRDAGQPEAADLDDDVMAWMDMATPADEMPGLATDEQLEMLATASGAEADALFVELMTAHHLGGIHMAEYAAEHAGSEEVRAMAESMVRGQRGDIVEMEGLLAG